MLIIWPFEISELCRPALKRIQNKTTFITISHFRGNAVDVLAPSIASNASGFILSQRLRSSVDGFSKLSDLEIVKLYFVFTSGSMEYQREV